MDWKEYINKADPKELALIAYQILYSPNEKFDWVNLMPFADEEKASMTPKERFDLEVNIYHGIKKKIGEKAILREVNKQEQGWSNQDFDDYWDSMQEDRLQILKDNNYHVENNSAQRADKGCDKSYPPIVAALIGFIIGSLLGKLLILLLRVIFFL